MAINKTPYRGAPLPEGIELHCFLHTADDCMVSVPCYSAADAEYWLYEAFDDNGDSAFWLAHDADPKPLRAILAGLVAEALNPQHRRKWPRQSPTVHSAYGVTVGVCAGTYLL